MKQILYDKKIEFKIKLKEKQYKFGLSLVSVHTILELLWIILIHLCHFNDDIYSFTGPRHVIYETFESFVYHTIKTTKKMNSTCKSNFTSNLTPS